MDLAKLVYRPHIDGLRAVAVVVVFLFHLAPATFPGGYLGVDIFFVISGFVITQSLYKSYLKYGKIKIVDFYLRRFNRLYPALLTMVLVVTALYILFGFLWDTNLFLKSSLASIFAISNLYFLKQGESYFDQGSINPLLHTWSLGIEEQFYFLYPMVLIGLLFLFKKTARKEWWMMWSLVLGAVVLYSSFVFGSNDLWANYYWPFARFWELLVGCGLFFLHIKCPLTKGKRTLITLGMVALIGIVFLQPFTQNIQLETLLAVLATALVIYAGMDYTKDIGKVLSAAPVLYIGALSYSLYLWHLPVIYFLDLYVEKNLYFLLAPVLTFFFGFLSYHYIEQKFRYSEKLTSFIKKAFFYAIGAGVLIVVAVVTYGIRDSVFQINKSFNTFASSVKEINYIEHKANLQDRIEPRYYLDGRNVHSLCGENSLTLSSDIVTDCLKTSDAETLIYLTGDSHATHLLPMIDSSDLDVDVYFQGHPRTGLVDKSVTTLIDDEALGNKRVQLEVFADQYEKVVLVSSFFLAPLEADIENIENKLQDYIDTASPYAEIAFVAPTPVFKAGPASCVANGVHCTLSKSADEARRAKTLTMLQSLVSDNKGVYLFDLHDSLCPAEKCEIYNAENDRLLYRDDDHISVEESKRLAPDFATWFNQGIWQE